MKEQIQQLAKHYSQEFIEIRRHIHAHPELSFQEVETAAYVRKKLDSWGIPYTAQVGGEGVVAVISGKNPSSRAVALRGDMDALPIEEKTGVDIIHKALAQPISMIAQNSGQDAGWVLRTVEDSKIVDYGFDSINLEFGSMFKKGIVDPAKVVRSALENAASVATMILTTEALVTDLPQKKDDMSGGMPGGMPGMGM